MTTNQITIGTLSKEDQQYFNRVFPGYTSTGETLHETYIEKNGQPAGGCTYVVFRHTGNGRKYTPYGMCRDCGTHYIIARWSRYDRIEKGTLKITYDTEDI